MYYSHKETASTGNHKAVSQRVHSLAITGYALLTNLRYRSALRLRTDLEKAHSSKNNELTIISDECASQVSHGVLSFVQKVPRLAAIDLT